MYYFALRGLRLCYEEQKGSRQHPDKHHVPHHVPLDEGSGAGKPLQDEQPQEHRVISPCHLHQLWDRELETRRAAAFVKPGQRQEK